MILFFFLIGAQPGDAPVLNPLSVPPNISIGDITEIYCSIKRGSLPVTFKWLHNGKEVHAHSKYKITTSEINSHFFLGKIQASDIGNFTCIASNTFGTDSKTENVFMEGIFKTDIFLYFFVLAII